MAVNSNDLIAEKAAWSLPQWLDYLDQIHPNNIEMGLSRTRDVLQRLQLDFSHSTLITVAGTNGKGSTCAFLEQAALQLQLSVGVYSSPHIHDYRERLRINHQILPAEQHCQAFCRVEAARDDIALTYFEFSTLACLVLLADAGLDWILLEVGLGGRLDATNVLDADIAVITSIDLDHQDWLGDTREKIAIEKAGILREGRLAVIGEPNPPLSLQSQLQKLQCDVLLQGRDFEYQMDTGSWNWRCLNEQRLNHLPLPGLPMQNISTGLAVLRQLGFSLSHQHVSQIITKSALPGRFETLAKQPRIIVDVAHNPQACRYLSEQIQRLNYTKLFFICAMLADKDIASSLMPLQKLDADWLLSELDTSRTASLPQLKSALKNTQKVITFASVKQALLAAKQQANDDDCIVVFGSFYTVAEAQQALESEK